MSSLPRAPTFPKFVESANSTTDSEARAAAVSDSMPGKVVEDAAAMLGQQATRASTTPVQARSRSRVKNLLLWRDPKASAVAFCLMLAFFYCTLFKGLSIVAVIGGAGVLCLVPGLILVRVNSLSGGKLDGYIKRPAVSKPFFGKESVEALAEVMLDEGNEVADAVRDVMYCDKTGLTVSWIVISLVVYIVGSYFSLLPVFFVFSLGCFTVPLAYEMNKSKVDTALEKAGGVATERALKFKDLAVTKLEASPAVQKVSRQLGLTPVKKRL